MPPFIHMPLKAPWISCWAICAWPTQDFIAALDIGVRISPVEFGRALSAALVARDDAAARQLAALERKGFTNPNIECPEILYQLAELQASLTLGQADAVAGRAALLRQTLQRQSPNAIPRPQDFQAPLALAVADGDADALQAAVAAHLVGYPKIFRRPSLREASEAMLDIWGLGFLSLAMARDMAPVDGNPYLPIALLTA